MTESRVEAGEEGRILAARAKRCLEMLLEMAQGPGGMIVSIVPFDRRRAFQEGQEFHWWLAEPHEKFWGHATPMPTLAEWLYGENTLFATGMLLWSQLERHAATGEAEAIDVARKCFRDLCNIFRLGGELEPGVLGKPHGGRAGATTSFDQAANPILPFVRFVQEHATPAERELATGYMHAHGEYFIRRDWVLNHHGHLSRVIDRPHTSLMKYLVCLYAAYELTGETRFRDEAARQLDAVIAAGRLPWPTNPYETNHNLWYWSVLCDYWSRTELADRFDWDGCIRSYWRAFSLALDEKGVPLLGHYDHVADTFTPHPEGWFDPATMTAYATDTPKTGRGQWFSSRSINGRPSNTACVAMLASIVRRRGLDDEADKVARRALLAMDEDRMRWIWDDGTLPEEMQPMMNYFLTDVPGMWLTAYWQGRAQGFW